MKNIHVLPTDKPNFGIYLVLSKEGKLCIWNTNTMGSQKTLPTQNIYITSSDEEIKRDWFISLNDDESFMEIIKNNEVDDFSEYADEDWVKNCKKIILTTDQDLIADGVQAIDDEFLEWFVKNANESGVPFDRCEVNWTISAYNVKKEYRVVIPKEEPKQETLEEAASNYAIKDFNYSHDYDTFMAGAKWQAERMYSEFDLDAEITKLNTPDRYDNVKQKYNYSESDIVNLFEQHKKKS